jgi:hypothetical protein
MILDLAKATSDLGVGSLIAARRIGSGAATSRSPARTTSSNGGEVMHDPRTPESRLAFYLLDAMRNGGIIN